MRALLKKDRIWLSMSFLIGAGVFLVVLLDRRPDTLWIGGERRQDEDLFVAWWLFAGLFGLYGGLRDRLLGTREYLLHRPVRPARVFWTRCLGCLLVMTGAVLLPYLLLWIWPFGDENRAVWEFGTAWTHLALSTSMWAVFAVGAYGATLPASKFAAVLQTGLVGAPLLYAGWRAQFPLGSGWAVSPWFYVGVQVLLAGSLLALACRHYVRGQDRDRDVPPRPKVANALLVSVCAVLLASIAISELQRDGYRSLIHEYPVVLELDDGTFVRVRRDWDGRQTVLRVVDEHDEFFDPGAEPSYTSGLAQYWYLPRDRWPQAEQQLEPGSDRVRSGHALGGVRLRVYGVHADAGHDVRAYFRLPQGVLDVYGLVRSRREDAGPPWKRTFRRSDGRPFSVRTRLMTGTSEKQPLFAHDRADASIWFLAKVATDTAFRPAQLPSGDRVQRVGTLKEDGLFLPRSPGWGSEDDRIAVQGEKGVYVWEDDRFVTAPDATVKRPSPDRSPPRAGLIERRGDDPLAFGLVIRGEGGRVRYEVEYRPRTAEAKLMVAVTCAGTILRSPALVWPSLALEPPGLWPFDPLVSYGGRWWLIAANLAFAAFFVWLARRRLRRLGAGGLSVGLWTLLVALGGLTVWIVFRIVEHRRAHAPVRVLEPMEAPPLLIHTA